ncbi:MAG: antibiotic biosynthesis monooxygenase [Alphaproteobacteria bacterium]|nr:antibiotic biosynthesis monooxygenase [Alphaproteobacteria bacterium]
MSKHALFLHHRTKPGARDAVQQVWQKHMQPAIEANEGHEVYVYSFGIGPDTICAFQVYGSAEDANAFLKIPAYLAYELEVAPLLDGPPHVEVLRPQWIKGKSFAQPGPVKL